ncbi:MAG: hypothetical protein JW776_14315 [Candidatus Lokiarchaeota archaeon]|nr:hypothetical protein [Candidatus Lokiarchaeota archaeon]
MEQEYRPKFSSLIDLFESISVVEKGIEQVYDFLLKTPIVEDINVLVETLDLKPKRIYKINSVLKDLGLIQIYYRPMKIQLLDPVDSWEKLIQTKINTIQEEASSRIKYCHESLEKMFSAYELVKTPQMLVEFVSFVTPELDLESEFFTLVSQSESWIAHGIFYKYDYSRTFEAIKKFSSEFLTNIAKMIKTNQFKILVSDDYLEQVDNLFEKNKKFIPTLGNLLDANLNFDLRHTNKQFSNFVLKDQSVLIQPSFDPSGENLIGCFISSPKEIVEVFSNKFNELFKDAKPVRRNEKSKQEHNFYQILAAL